MIEKTSLGETCNIFSEIALVSEEHQATNLSQGSPDFPMDARLKQSMFEAFDADVNKYASTSVVPELIAGIISFNAKKQLPILISENELAVTTGSTYSIFVALSTIVNANDEVIILEPCYETYQKTIDLLHAKAVYVSCENEWDINWQKIKDSITKKTKAVLVNSPNNPTGKIWSKKDWDLLWDIIKDTQIVVISDEVYDVYAYDSKPCFSAKNHSEIMERSFSIFSFEKMFHLSGWKCSYVLASSNLMKDFNKVHEYLTFTTNIFAQIALSKFLPEFDAKKQCNVFEGKRNLFYDLISGLPLEVLPKTEGGFFQTVNFQALFPALSDKDLALKLIRDFKVAGIPYSAFYHDNRNSGHVRFCFAKKDETIRKAVEMLHYITKKASQ